MKKISMLILVVFLLKSCAQAIKDTKDEENKIAFGPFIQQMSTRDATIVWSNLESKPTITDPDGSVQVIRECKQHKIHSANLKANTTFSYDVLNDGSYEGKGTLTTYPDKTEPFNFGAIGDTRSRNEIHAKILEKLSEVNPRFLVNSGDLVGNGRLIIGKTSLK